MKNYFIIAATLSVLVLPVVSFASCGSNLLTGGTATESEYYFYNGSYAFDGNDTTFWIDGSPAVDFPHWLKYNLGTATVVNKIGFLGYWEGGPSELSAKDVEVLGSNDDSSYDSLTSFVLINESGEQSFAFANTTAYTFYKFVMTSTYSSDSGGKQNNVYTINGFLCDATSTPATSSLPVSQGGPLPSPTSPGGLIFLGFSMLAGISYFKSL